MPWCRAIIQLGDSEPHLPFGDAEMAVVDRHDLLREIVAGKKMPILDGANVLGVMPTPAEAVRLLDYLQR